MNIFYTTNIKQNGVNSNPAISLGGFCSSTPIPNDDFNNLFGEISDYGVLSGRTQYICIAIKNTYSETVEGISFNIVKENEEDEWSSDFKIGFVLPNSSTGEILHTPNCYSMPSGIEMYPVDGTEESKVTIGNLEAGQWIGVWISRTPKKEYFDKINTDFAIIKQFFADQVRNTDSKVEEGAPTFLSNDYIINDTSLSNLGLTRDMLREIPPLPTEEKFNIEIDWLI